MPYILDGSSPRKPKRSPMTPSSQRFRPVSVGLTPPGPSRGILRIDTDLIAAAAEGSTTAPEMSQLRLQIASWISALPGKERDRLLADLIADEDPHLLVELQQRALSAARGNATSGSGPPRTAAELMERARELGEARRKKEAAERARQRAQREREAAKRRKEHLESLRGKDS